MKHPGWHSGPGRPGSKIRVNRNEECARTFPGAGCGGARELCAPFYQLVVADQQSGGLQVVAEATQCVGISPDQGGLGAGAEAGPLGAECGPRARRRPASGGGHKCCRPRWRRSRGRGPADERDRLVRNRSWRRARRRDGGQGLGHGLGLHDIAVGAGAQAAFRVDRLRVQRKHHDPHRRREGREILDEREVRSALERELARRGSA